MIAYNSKYWKKSVAFEFRTLHRIKSHAHWLKQMKRIFSLVYLHIKNVYILLTRTGQRETMKGAIARCYLWKRHTLEWWLILAIPQNDRRRVTSVFPEDNRTRMLLSSCVRTVMLSTPSHTVLSPPIHPPYGLAGLLLRPRSF